MSKMISSVAKTLQSLYGKTSSLTDYSSNTVLENDNIHLNGLVQLSHTDDNAVISNKTNVSFVKKNELDKLFYTKIESYGWKSQPVKAVDGSNNVYMVGQYEQWEGGSLTFYNNTAPLSPSLSIGYNGWSNIFVAKYNKVGTVQWATRISGHYNKYDPHVSSDHDGNILVGCETNDDIESEGIQIFQVGSDETPAKILAPINTTNSIVVKYNTSGTFGWNLRFVSPDVDESGSGVYDIRTCTDKHGNIYTCGKFEGRSLNIYDSSSDTLSVGSIQKENDSGSTVLFLAKFNSSGLLQWITKLDAKPDSEDEPYVACDGEGNVYMCGDYDDDPLYIYDTTSSTTPKKILPNDTSDDCTFIAKYTPEGVLLWAIRLGHAESYNAKCAVDSSGNVYLAGTYRDDTLDIYDTAHEDIPVAVINHEPDYNDIFIIKFNSQGLYQWRNRVSNLETDYSSEVSICIDGDDSLYMSSNFYQRNLEFYNASDIDSSVYTLNYLDNEDVFLAKWNKNGVFQWATFVGGYSDEYDSDIVADSLGHVYLSGIFGSNPLYIYDVKHNDPEGDEVAQMALTESGYGVFLIKYNKFGIINPGLQVYLEDSEDVPTGVRKSVVLVKTLIESDIDDEIVYLNIVNSSIYGTNPPTTRIIFALPLAADFIMYDGLWQIVNYLVFPEGFFG